MAVTLDTIIAIVGLTLGIGSVAFGIFKSINVDKLVEKRVKEELAPYREFLEAGTKSIKRHPQEIMGSMTRYTGQTHIKGLTVVNLPTENRDL